MGRGGRTSGGGMAGAGPRVSGTQQTGLSPRAVGSPQKDRSSTVFSPVSLLQRPLASSRWRRGQGAEVKGRDSPSTAPPPPQALAGGRGDQPSLRWEAALMLWFSDPSLTGRPRCVAAASLARRGLSSEETQKSEDYRFATRRATHPAISRLSCQRRALSGLH